MDQLDPDTTVPGQNELQGGSSCRGSSSSAHARPQGPISRVAPDTGDSAVARGGMRPEQTPIDRRSMLIGGLGLGGLIVMGSRADARVRTWGMPQPQESAGKSTHSAGRTLVLLQLTGGNDALSMVVPWADDDYNAARSTTRIDAKDVLKLDGYRGFHPELKGLRTLWDAGTVALVEGCGYPRPIRSHFQSYEIWHTGSERGRLSGPGWIGKLCDAAWPKEPDPELVVHVGATAPYSLYSVTHPPLAFQTPATYRWAATESEDLQAYRRAAEADMKELEKKRKQTGQEKMLERLRGVLDDANQSSIRIRRAAAAYDPKVTYPGDDLGESLRIAAALVDARLGSRVVSVELSGFDTHQNQRGQHDNLMKRLDAALTAFMLDIRERSVGQEVVVVVFSEFGRRVKENGSRGTDHGVAAPMMVIGHGVKGGLYGKHPSLKDLDDGDLVHTTDFRSVYGTVIDRWFNVDHAKVLGAKYPTLGFLPA